MRTIELWPTTFRPSLPIGPTDERLRTGAWAGALPPLRSGEVEGGDMGGGGGQDVGALEGADEGSGDGDGEVVLGERQRLHPALRPGLREGGRRGAPPRRAKEGAGGREGTTARPQGGGESR